MQIAESLNLLMLLGFVPPSKMADKPNLSLENLNPIPIKDTHMIEDGHR